MCGFRHTVQHDISHDPNHFVHNNQLMSIQSRTGKSQHHKQTRHGNLSLVGLLICNVLLLVRSSMRFMCAQRKTECHQRCKNRSKCTNAHDALRPRQHCVCACPQRPPRRMRDASLSRDHNFLCEACATHRCAGRRGHARTQREPGLHSLRHQLSSKSQFASTQRILVMSTAKCTSPMH